MNFEERKALAKEVIKLMQENNTTFEDAKAVLTISIKILDQNMKMTKI